jgi:organic hydroperoxide reductase OsmC/OhrA
MKTLVTVVQRTTTATTPLWNKLQIWQGADQQSATSLLQSAHNGCTVQKPISAFAPKALGRRTNCPPSFLGPSVPLPTIQRECMGGHRIHPTTSIHPSETAVSTARGQRAELTCSAGRHVVQSGSTRKTAKATPLHSTAHPNCFLLTPPEIKPRTTGGCAVLLLSHCV